MSVVPTAARAAAVLSFTVLTADPIAAQLPSMRPDVGGIEAAVTSDHVLASAAGMEVLKRGGNAVDAAITMAGVLAVVRPHMNGVGGDNFMLIRLAKTGEIVALNGSGRAGSKATPAFFREKGLTAVPGVRRSLGVRAWRRESVGRRAPEVRHDHAVAGAATRDPVCRARLPGVAAPQCRHHRIEEEGGGRSRARPHLLPNGEAPPVGSLLKQPELARTLRSIAASGPDFVYKGALAKQIAQFMEKEGGLVTAADLPAHADVGEPISQHVHGQPGDRVPA